MSKTPTWGIATAKRSGRWFVTAPIKRPPFEPPWIASFLLEVYLCSIKYSPAAIKSSKTFCFFIFFPAECHASPYSRPPRKFTQAKMPPFSKKAILAAEKAGGREIAKPPYPYIIVGLFPSSLISFFETMCIGIFVPSLLLKKTCSHLKSPVLIGMAGTKKSVKLFVFIS